eukprot:CAMPEP_0171025494 /NCGR_PEP_ID=MMETSP0736-20130129/33672_1 /TAXON_ID=186038 /ORGANISM="Fragilariopsis kerguelensis, Strain L26-C5" /LENGTH=142 /DNA_ID=CAMNT_0011465753 /DNA_START=593 /DNA_END=1017 /DNA_ORIENTATION=-
MTVTTGGMGWKESKLNILLVLFDADDVATDTDDDDDEKRDTHNIVEERAVVTQFLSLTRMTIELSPSLLSSLTITITFNFIAIAITFTLTFSVIFIAITFTSIFIYDPLSLLMNLILTLFDCVADDEADANACPPSIPLPPP